MQELDKFVLPANFRGRSSFVCQAWWLVQSLLFSTSPQFLYGWRVFLLRLFGAKIGKNVIIRPSVRVTYPWKLTIGDNSWIGDNVELYTLGEINIGNNTVISQRSYICTGSHDFTEIDFPIYAKAINIHDSVWLATDVFVSPGVTIHQNAVVGARSSVFNDLAADYVYIGSPAKPIKPRNKN
ncbi:putative colanic acid biosynthesis acetyltransferase [Pseudomonas helleri]|uniref:Colanic acid biosynthesis acetyltransferase WcaF n=1 Tax=Pseudomonas helleri TaxID=1608996 RepID=A0A7X1Y649_9PSED|nr:putative colanic acid biosynthesis acetyltransferase [Pseudomonas helleri]MQT95698.1 colanic acid biosynthesis acetyltransferase WcaF [Pseudomonas helleri]MQU31299.1 colanic acid biosynthesis acetyltransferase WcaF [Pseudomonas helleri]